MAFVSKAGLDQKVDCITSLGADAVVAAQAVICLLQMQAGCREVTGHSIIHEPPIRQGGIPM